MIVVPSSSWAEGTDGTAAIERYASLIDRLARRLEDVVGTAAVATDTDDRQVPR